MVTTHQLTNQRVKAIKKVVLEDSNTMKDILDPSSVGFRPHHGLLLSISYATKDEGIQFRPSMQSYQNLESAKFRLSQDLNRVGRILL